MEVGQTGGNISSQTTAKLQAETDWGPGAKEHGRHGLEGNSGKRKKKKKKQKHKPLRC